jgi:Clostripain family/FlgD Ig-like domain
MKPRGFIRAVLLLLILGTAAGLDAREWTVLVYMAADNDLAFQSEIDLREMETSGSTAQVAVVVQQDVPGAGGRRYLVQRGRRMLVDSLGTINMADPKVLTDFGTWGTSRFPAKRYALILWDHGNGWSLARGGRDPARIQSFGSDWSSGDAMGIADGELRTALVGIERSLGKPLDLLAFDGCILQEAEVALEVAGTAEVLVGSQLLVPADGYAYGRFLSYLTNHPSADGEILAEELVDEYISFYQGSGLEVSNSAIRLGSASALISAADALIQAYLNAPGDPGVRGARDSVYRILAGQEADLGDFLSLVERDARTEPIRNLAAELRKTQEQMTLKSKATGPDSAKISGLSVWFPRTLPEFGDWALTYYGLQWARQSGWDRMAYASYGIVGGVRPEAPETADVLRGEDNAYTIVWHSPYAPARIGAYEVREMTGRKLLWEDGGEGGASPWNLKGFIQNEGDAHSGKRSYYAYQDSATMSLREPASVEGVGWLSLWAKRSYGQKVIAEISPDSLFASVTPLDSITYGSKAWATAGFALPSGLYYIRLKAPGPGVYLDDTRLDLFSLEKAKLVAGKDTFWVVKNKPKGTCCYQVRAQDQQGIWGLYSPVAEITVNDFAPAYIFPNPFTSEVRLIVDGIQDEAKVRIYSVTGELLRTLDQFTRQSDGTVLFIWDGRNQAGKETAAGVYFYLVSMPGRMERGILTRVR